MSSQPVSGAAQLHLLFDQMADAVYLLDPDTSNIVWGNRKAWESLGLSAEEVLNHSVLSLQKDVHGMPQWSEIAAAIRATDCYRFNGRHRHKDGHEVVVEVNTTHFSMDGRPYFLSVARDITNRVEQERDAQSRERQLWFALNEASDGLWDWHVPTGQLFFSPQLKRMLGYGPDEMAPVLSTWSDNVHPEDKPSVIGTLQAHLHGKRERYEAEYRLRNRNGHYIWVHDRGRVCDHAPDGSPARVVGTVRNINDQKELEAQLQQMAAHDVLTGLPNRREGLRFLESQLSLCRRMALPLAVVFIDVDAFKTINDRFGHGTGDTVLQRIADVLRSGIRSSDRVCRWGGEEFVLIAPGTTPEGVMQLADKLRVEVQAAVQVRDVPVSVSMGVAVAEGDRLDAQRLLFDADAALYRAKRNGRNRVEWAA